jgi:hypothetical protein
MKLQAVKIERVTDGDRVIQLPFKCFACHDGGLVGGKFLAEFVEGESDIPFICNRDECEAGKLRRSAWSANTDRDYQNAFDVRLDRYNCNDIHNWEKDIFLKDIIKRNQNKPVIIEFSEAVERRQTIIARIKTVATALGGLQENFDKAVKFYSNQDSTDYPSWEALSNAALEVLLKKVEQKLSESDDF